MARVLKIFLTETVIDGVKKGGRVKAFDFEHAQLLCAPEESVLGELFLEITCDSMTEDRANDICKAFADNGIFGIES